MAKEVLSYHRHLPASCHRYTSVPATHRVTRAELCHHHRLADPSSVSPFEYFGIPISFCLGWVFFAEAPFGDLFPGIIFIVSAGILIMVRERITARRAAGGA